MGSSAAACCCAAKDDGVEVTAFSVSAQDGVIPDERFLEATQKRYQISIQKAEQNDQLGMDVKHRLGRLVVLAIRRGGAVDRANVMAKQQGFPGMQVNDVIVEVNGATLDTGMVAACKSALVLNVTFIRREHSWPKSLDACLTWNGQRSQAALGKAHYMCRANVKDQTRWKALNCASVMPFRRQVLISSAELVN